MEKCMYCGRPLSASPEKTQKIQIKEKDFELCSDGCRTNAERYLASERKFRPLLYLILCAAAVVIIVTAIGGAKDMLFANIAQIVCGLAFIAFPYPVSALSTYENVSIRRIITACRVVGVLLGVSGVLFLLFR